jgi:carbonic anhydrase
MSASSEFQAANSKYVAGFGDKASLALPPAKKVSEHNINRQCRLTICASRSLPSVMCFDQWYFRVSYLALVTCMDARIDPAAHLGIHEGDAHIIRSAGGVAYVVIQY